MGRAMTVREQVDRMLRALGSDLGIALQLGPDGQASLTFADGMVCTLGVADEEEKVALGAAVAAVPPVGRKALFETALRRNEGEAGTGGGGIGYDEARTELVLWRARTTKNLDKSRLALFLAEFMDAAMADRDRLREAGAASVPAEPSGAPRVDSLDLMRYTDIRG